MMEEQADEKVPISSQIREPVPEQGPSPRIPYEANIDGDESATLNFYLLCGITEIFGIVSVIIALVWMGHYRGGFAWDSKKVFNYHPVFMILGLVFLYGNGTLVYRVFRKTDKNKVKIIHASVQICALVFAVVGLKAVFDSHNLPKPPIPNMYSLHSWFGIITVVLFCVQWLFGFVAFLFPKFSDVNRAIYLKVHAFFGIGMLAMAVGTSLMGITEKLIFSVKNYNTKPPEGILANMLGLLLVIFCGLVIFLITKAEYRRKADPQIMYSSIE